MKKLFFIASLTLTALAVFSQTPQLFKYQAVARDNAGNLISENNVGIRITILQGSQAGTPVYSESFTAYTNQFGLFSINVGSGTVISGDFSSISWGTNNYYIKTEMDPAGGTAYSLMGTSQLLSVPYALYSENTENVDDADADPGNELQNLSIAGNNLSINPGNTVAIPAGASEINDLSDGKTIGYSVFLGTGAGAAEFGTTKRNVALGYFALNNNTDGYYNTAAGYKALELNIDGIYNSAFGYEALLNNTSGEFNTAVGRGALHDNDTGSSNTACGVHALFQNITGNKNTALGNNAAQANTAGSGNTVIGSGANLSNQEGNYNTIIGCDAGYAPYAHNKSGNVFLGYQAGKYEYGDNKLYIENSNSSSPLIYGEFDNNIVNVNGRLGINNAFPSTNYEIDVNAGTSGGIRTKSSGNSWLMIDKGATDDNGFISFQTDGSDKWVMGTYGADEDFRIINWHQQGSSDNTFIIDQSSSAIGLNTNSVYSTVMFSMYPGDKFDYGLYHYCDRYTSGTIYGASVDINNYSTSSASNYGIYSNVQKTGANDADVYAFRAFANDDQTGTGNRFIYGLYSSSSVASTIGTSYAYGVYGSGSVTSDYGYGVYYSGGLAGSGTKSAVVRTPGGPKEVYCQESPGNWFEDFGEGEMKNGKAVINIPADFLETVTINSQHPMKVFITPNADLKNWWVVKRENSFILHAPNAADGSGFDYRVVAKRKGYEDIRLREAPAAYTDHYLYPDIKDVPAEHRAEWVRLIEPKHRKPEWMSYLTPDEVKLLKEEEREEREKRTTEDTQKGNPVKSSTD